MRKRYSVIILVVVLVLLALTVAQVAAQSGDEPSEANTNSPPVLSWTGEPEYVSDGLHPESGSQATPFVYRVQYADADGDAPSFVRVRILKGGADITGSPFELSYISGDYVTGAIYAHSIAGLAAGSDYSYYYEAQDVNGADAPITTELPGPMVRAEIFWQYLSLVMRDYEPNVPPYVPSSPSPADGATDVWINFDLTWVGGDPNSAPVVTYDVYFEAGDSTPDELLCDGVGSTVCDPGTLAYSTDYYWQVVATDEHDASTTGPVWHFTSSAPNNPPHEPSSPSPADGATDQSIGQDLSWTGGDPDGDAVTYDVYLEATDPPTALACDNTAGLSCDPGQLQYGQTYYWQVISRDEHGATTSGPVWSFATLPTGPDLLIYDAFGTPQDWEWVIANYGAVTLDRGTGAAHVAELHENQKDAALVINVVDAVGNPLGGVPVVFWYSSAPALDEEWAHACGRTNGILDYTEPSGKIGFGMGTGAYYFPPAGGPHVVWVATPGTDCLGGMGMLGGTNHYHLDSIWKLPSGSALNMLPPGLDLSLLR
jgi:hypothetical protein